MSSRLQLLLQQVQEAEEATIPIEFPEIDKVHLENLPNLRSFSSGDIVEWPSLETVVVNRCPNLKKFGLGMIQKSQLKSVILENQQQIGDIDAQVSHLFELSDQFSTITAHNITDSNTLSKVLDNLQPSHFTNLMLFGAKSCDERLNIFLSILIKRSNKLEHIRIEQCQTLEHLFDLREFMPDENGYGKYFPQIKELILIELHKLKFIWNKDPAGIFGLSNMQMIHIKNCPSLQNLITPSAAEKLHQLNEIKIEECEMLEQVVEGEVTQTIKFPALRKVELLSLSKLIMFHSNNYPLNFPVLETLVIEKCPQLQSFTTGFATIDDISTTHENSFSKLNELILDSCNKLVCVISSKTLKELGNLEKLTVSHCKALKTVFKIQGKMYDHMESSVLQHLSELTLLDLPNLTHIFNKEHISFFQNLLILRVKQCDSLNWLAMPLTLTNIEVSDCETLQEILFINEGEETKRDTTFSQLKYISIENLTKLSTVFPPAFEFPSLETLTIANCSALETFVGESHHLKDHPELANSNCFFPYSLSLDKLKVLQVINQNMEKLWHNICPPKSFCELEDLILINNHKLLSVFPFNFIGRCNILQNLTVDKCELLTEVFNLEEDIVDHNIQKLLPELRKLALSNLSGLTHLLNNEPPVPIFPNLVSLHIVHCGNLKSVFSPSVAKNLGQLKFLKLYDCEKIEEVISSDENKDEKITFHKVECLILKDLPNLTSFCCQSVTSDWPKLQTVRVSNVPCMKTFSTADLNTPLLRSVFTTFVKKCWRGSLNMTISFIHEKSKYVT
ncbi:hypothetical protein VNO77_42993 [Canavalia gladiata]|uniref:Disease resistance protein At4g27190-like leucine-rich repeats domain-containing protein n=1 Tax=Canavalia gladiata TaxID=3824 RepID=A0AAN9JU03_CANGL